MAKTAQFQYKVAKSECVIQTGKNKKRLVANKKNLAVCIKAKKKAKTCSSICFWREIGARVQAITDDVLPGSDALSWRTRQESASSHIYECLALTENVRVNELLTAKQKPNKKENDPKEAEELSAAGAAQAIKGKTWTIVTAADDTRLAVTRFVFWEQETRKRDGGNLYWKGYKKMLKSKI